jgi:hypothetical protein
MSVASGMRARGRVGTACRLLLAALFGLAATAALLGGCQGSSRRTDNTYWLNVYGDPDTGRSLCCGHTERGNNR